MTDKEMDDFLVSTLQKILQEMKECADYVKDLTTPEYEEIKEYYEDVIADLSKILKTVKSVEDLAEMDEDEIGYVFEYLEDYATNFIISNVSEQKVKDQEEYNKLDELLYLFYDDDDDLLGEE